MLVGGITVAKNFDVKVVGEGIEHWGTPLGQQHWHIESLIDLPCPLSDMCVRC